MSNLKICASKVGLSRAEKHDWLPLGRCITCSGLSGPLIGLRRRPFVLLNPTISGSHPPAKVPACRNTQLEGNWSEVGLQKDKQLTEHISTFPACSTLHTSGEVTSAVNSLFRLMKLRSSLSVYQVVHRQPYVSSCRTYAVRSSAAALGR